MLIKFNSLTPSEQSRFIEVAGQWIDKNDLIASIDRKVKYHRNQIIKPYMLDDLDESRGVVVDEGAEIALRNRANLLPVGILDVKGDFDREEIISVFNPTGEYIGVGITSYSSEDIQKIKGKHSSLIPETLSNDYGVAVITERSLSINKPHCTESAEI